MTTVTLNITGDQLLPTLQGILDQMSPDDKAALLTSVASEWFKKEMTAEFDLNPRGYDRRVTTGAMELSRRLTEGLKVEVDRRINADPDLSSQVAHAVKAVTEAFPTIVREAVAQAMWQKVSHEVNEMWKLNSEVGNIAQRLKGV